MTSTDARSATTMRLVLRLLLLAWASSAVTAESPLRVYTSCAMPDGVVGECRSQPRVQAVPSDVQAGATMELPVDMRLPCADANRTCAENVDVAEVPARPPTGDHIGSCSVTLMPWSPFPCTYSTEAFKGVEGQNKTNWCFDQHTVPQQPGFEYARDLVTDGYSNLYHGLMPDKPCGHSSSSSSSSGSGAGHAPGYGKHFAKVLLTLTFRVAAGRQFDRTYWFQIGRAVAALGTCTEPTRWLGTDKWWSTTVDITHLQAYLAAGLPTRMSLANLLSNTYNVPLWAEAKVQYFWETHPPRPSVNLSPPPPPPAAAAGVAKSAAGAPAVVQAWGSYAGQEYDSTVEAVHSTRQPDSSSSSRTAGDADNAAQGGSNNTPAAAASVPDEVIPLIPRPEDAESVTVLGGNGGRPWPRATFRLPADLSALGNIYRAQLLVTPKADACEEFWAMNPSGAATNSSCGGFSTGEPYREVRVYVNGQLAGFTPIYYTMYTGGVDPRLWSAIVASYTYSLPTYTFDLSPWLPQLNSKPNPSSSSSIASPSALTRPASASSSSVSIGGDSRLPDILQKPAPARKLTQEASPAESASGPHSDSQTPSNPQQQQQREQQTPMADWDSVGEAAHTITVELGGATGNGWVVANTLLLWRAVGPKGLPEIMSGQQQTQVQVSTGFEEPLQSDCRPLRDDLAMAGKCTLQIRDRSFEASSVLHWQGHKWEAHVRYTTNTYDSVVTFNNDVNVTDGALTWHQETHHQAAWYVTKQLPTAATTAAATGEQQQQALHGPHTDEQQQKKEKKQGRPTTITQQAVSFDWLNGGVVAAGGAFEYSFNSTLLQPTVYTEGRALAGAQGWSVTDSSGTGSDRGAGGFHAAHAVTGTQHHYQRAIMLNVYTPQSPKCVVPDNATHTVTLRNTISSSSGEGSAAVQERGKRLAADDDSSCVRRWGTCGFCGAWLMSNVVEWGGQNC